jgi:hypothetical protein
MAAQRIGQPKKASNTVLTWVTIVVVGTLMLCSYWWGGHQAKAQAETSSGQAFS